MNSALDSFTMEMKSQGTWDDVTIVMVSEFARTLVGNTGIGSDHAWGGNYFIAGGEVKGGRILGEYPNILSEDGPLVFEPGVVIPTLPWDSLWNGVAQWFGVTSDDVSKVIKWKLLVDCSNIFKIDQCLLFIMFFSSIVMIRTWMKYSPIEIIFLMICSVRVISIQQDLHQHQHPHRQLR